MKMRLHILRNLCAGPGNSFVDWMLWICFTQLCIPSTALHGGFCLVYSDHLAHALPILFFMILFFDFAFLFHFFVILFLLLFHFPFIRSPVCSGTRPDCSCRKPCLCDLQASCSWGKASWETLLQVNGLRYVVVYTFT